ncbi:hypothetical protein ASE04_27475 [Rhizobium sp. Root708]|uniref:hypothetical protein n=1 Tax=Rhizobium sp. Root708 TaxID=1736592 RepID=UPI00070133BB|nr:hypothetical protein [Rhizobium sp. Root708]KRB58457.1 hypothetical protein ASE04_27475 [Rhizobium sp. Root708]
MKFVIEENYRYFWPVKVRIPDPEAAGKIIEQTLKIQFEPLPRDEALAAQERHENLTTAKERADHEHEQLLLVCKNWDDVIAKDGGAVSFSEDRFRSALQMSWFRTAVYEAYADSLNGQEARLGN